MSSGGPAPQNYTGLAQQQADTQNNLLQQQTQQNRPNQTNAFGVSSNWGVGPDGRPVQSTSFGGPLGQASNALQTQAAEQYRTPFSLGGLAPVGSGEQARDQAISSAYGQATSRLDPQWNQREEAQRGQLLNQGLQPGSAAYDRAMSQMGQQRNDAYTSAMANAIQQGTAAGDSIFRNNLAGRQQGVQELLTQYQMPLQQLLGMQGLTGQQGFNMAGQGVAPQFLQAGAMQDQAAMQRWQNQQQQMADLFGAGTQLAGTAAMYAMSDERAKTDIQRQGVEVVPGVELLTFCYKPEHNMPGLYAGVSAQQLQKVHPEHVGERPDGFLGVSPHFAPQRID